MDELNSSDELSDVVIGNKGISNPDKETEVEYKGEKYKIQSITKGIYIFNGTPPEGFFLDMSRCIWTPQFIHKILDTEKKDLVAYLHSSHKNKIVVDAERIGIGALCSVSETSKSFKEFYN